MALPSPAANGRVYYGAVGNGQTVALIGPNLAVDWLCLPRFDGYPIFARALDPQRGGFLTLRLGGEPSLRPVGQHYLGRSNILITEAEAAGLLVRTVDYMPWDGRYLARQITVTNPGDEPRTEWLEVVAEPTRTLLWPEPERSQAGASGPHLISGPDAALAYGFRGGGRGVRVELRLPPGRSRRLVLTVAYGETTEEALANWHGARTGDLLQEQRFWRQWLAGAVRPDLPERDLREAYWRSLLTIKLLCHRDSGAILAAPTASFPAVPRGHDNWDYRFCWLRDGFL